MNEMLPEGTELKALMGTLGAASREEIAGRIGDAFLVLISGGLARPAPMQRTVTWDDPAASTGETGFYVARLAPKAPGVRAVSVGRAATNDVVLVDTTISKSHAFVHRDARTGSFSVTDAGSHNGTYVEGAKVAARGEGEPTPLRSGQQLRLGSVSLSFLLLDDLLQLGRSIRAVGP